MTQEQLGKYIQAQLFPKPPKSQIDSYFGPPLNTVTLTDDDATVFQQLLFGNQPFQIRGGPLHGCTQIVVVGSLGVWMVSVPHSNHEP